MHLAFILCNVILLYVMGVGIVKCGCQRQILAVCFQLPPSFPDIKLMFLGFHCQCFSP